MQTTTSTTTGPPVPTTRRAGRPARRFGYGVAIAVNGVLLFIVNNLLAWGFPGFLTEDFDRVLPILNTSLVVSIVVNVLLIGYDEAWFRSATNVLTSAFSLAVTIRLIQVFPFDLAGSWETFARWFLVVMAVLVGFAMVVEAVRAAGGLIRRTTA